VTQSISALVSTSLTLERIKSKRHLETTLWKKRKCRKRRKNKKRKKSMSENLKTFECSEGGS
jgi:hypothetical protein